TKVTIVLWSFDAESSKGAGHRREISLMDEDFFDYTNREVSNVGHKEYDNKMQKEIPSVKGKEDDSNIEDAATDNESKNSRGRQGEKFGRKIKRNLLKWSSNKRKLRLLRDTECRTRKLLVNQRVPLSEDTGVWIPVSVPPMSESQRKEWNRDQFLEHTWKEVSHNLTEVNVETITELLKTEPLKWFCGGLFCNECSKGRSLMPAKFLKENPQRVYDVVLALKRLFCKQPDVKAGFK
ncbi:hypothetical protein Tco_1024729, partial [Tanacetum coccineum]